MRLIFAALLLAFVLLFNSIELSLQSDQKDVSYMSRPKSPPRSEISTNQERPVQLPIRSQSFQGFVNIEEAPPPSRTPAIRPIPIRIRPETSRAIKTKAIRPLPIRIRPEPPRTIQAIRPLPTRTRPEPPQPTQAIQPLPIRIRPEPPRPTQAIRPVPIRIRPLPALPPPPPILPPPRRTQAIRPLPIRIRPHPVPENTPSPETYSNESIGSNVLDHP